MITSLRSYLCLSKAREKSLLFIEQILGSIMLLMHKLWSLVILDVLLSQSQSANWITSCPQFHGPSLKTLFLFFNLLIISVASLPR